MTGIKGIIKNTQIGIIKSLISQGIPQATNLVIHSKECQLGMDFSSFFYSLFPWEIGETMA